MQSVCTVGSRLHDDCLAQSYACQGGKIVIIQAMGDPWRVLPDEAAAAAADESPPLAEAAAAAALESW